MSGENWQAMPNTNGRTPIVDAPKDRPIIVRNLANRVPGSVKRFSSDHLAFFDPDEGCFVRLQDDLFLQPVFIFFHLWRELEP